MRIFNSVAMFWLLLGLLFTPACGGGGGGGGPAVTVIARLAAQLSGANEPTVIDADARGAVVVEIRSNGQIEFAATAEAAWVADIIGMHIHRGAPGVDGVIVVDLLGGGATFDGTTLTASGTVTADTALANEIATTPGDFYVNIHTSGPGAAGFVRNQLGAFTALEWHATLLGSNETTVADADARGAATFTVTGLRSLDYVLAMDSPAITAISAAHIHVGLPGTDGIIVVDLQVGSGVIDAVAGTIRGTVTFPISALARIGADPAGFYANAHTLAVPAGIVRGQLAEGPVEMWASLTGDQISPPVDPLARGGVSLQLDSFTSGVAILGVPPAQDIDLVTGAFVRVGGPGAVGAPLIDLQAGSDYGGSFATGSAEGSITLDQELFTRLLADPNGFHCLFTTASAPNGLVRGQLTQDPITFFSSLSGAEATTVVDPNAGGAMNVVFTGIHRCSFTVTMTLPPVTDLTEALIKDGDTGVDGPTLIDLFGSGDVTIAGSSATGTTELTGRTFVRMLAASELFYGDVHTLAQPLPGPGIARGQAVLVSGDIPPAGLSYTTPVVYETGAAIVNNVPTSVGGAVNSYSVSPPLPAGLVLNPVTGILSGTPTAAVPATDYTVTASNDAGNATFVINITVNPGAPTNLVYNTPVSYVVGTPITPNTPTNSGGAIDSYMVSPALPNGLSLNPNTGVISGTPTATAAAANYTITGSNITGSTTATVNITVAAALQPPSISYSTPVSYPTASAITPNSPTNTGGTATSWSVSPSLPSGLSLNTSTGVISGTPDTVTAAANYTVTATNAAGSGTATVNITVTLGAPNITAYSNTPNIGYVTGGFMFASMVPTNSGGAASSWSISPALPAGISISSSTGIISGTPQAQSGQTTYTVTASNATGSATFQVVITILP